MDIENGPYRVLTPNVFLYGCVCTCVWGGSMGKGGLFFNITCQAEKGMFHHECLQYSFRWSACLVNSAPDCVSAYACERKCMSTCHVFVSLYTTYTYITFIIYFLKSSRTFLFCACVKPLNKRLQQDLERFRRNLKTYLFKQAFM